jgi:hypothetical protein
MSSAAEMDVGVVVCMAGMFAALAHRRNWISRR